MIKNLFVFLFATVALKGYAQYPRVDIPGSEVRKITSSIVTGQEYELQILLPASYKTSNKQYPVVYLMDSQWDFPLVKSIYGQQYYDGFIPELIVVGVTWSGVNPNPDSLRVRDYTPTNDGRQKQSGGADKFLSFMKDELFPFIEKNYRADSNHRTLMGCSLGGLITLYTLFTHTDMFAGYVAASPAIGWGNQVIYQYEKSFYDKELKQKNWNGLELNEQTLYMTVGGVERSSPEFQKLANLLDSRDYSRIKLFIQSKVLENTGHSGTKSETYSRGLQWSFDRPIWKLRDEELNRYVGTYNVSGNTIEIKNEGGGLVLYFSPNNKYILYAGNLYAGHLFPVMNDFYATSEFLNIHFKTDDNGKVQGFQLDRYTGSQFVTKIK